MIKQLAIYEPTTCDCRQCRSPCTHGPPGCLAPSDLDHMAEHLGLEDPTREFILTMFQASTDGPRAPVAGFPDGQTPAIRPRQRGDGSCVFLGDEGQCTVYPVRPFECGRVNGCDPASGAAAMKALGTAIAASMDYVQTWLWMRREQGK